MVKDSIEIADLKGTSSEIEFDILSSQDLENMRENSLSDVPSAPSKKNKRYFIVTCGSEDDR
jgi:hypothetical protein